MKINTDIIAKILKIGKQKIANRLYVLRHKIAQNTLINQKMAHKTVEQIDIETKAFILKTFCFILVLVSVLFSYSIVFIEQPLFTEAPADKAILAILSMAMAQIFTVVSLVLTGKSPTSPPPPFNPCQGVSQIGVRYGGTLDNSTSGFSIDPTSAWYPPPPPTTPPTLENDEERERMANARADNA